MAMIAATRKKNELKTGRRNSGSKIKREGGNSQSPIIRPKNNRTGKRPRYINRRGFFCVVVNSAVDCASVSVSSSIGVSSGACSEIIGVIYSII
jgi:hypothetical protein